MKNILDKIITQVSKVTDYNNEQYFNIIFRHNDYKILEENIKSQTNFSIKFSDFIFFEKYNLFQYHYHNGKIDIDIEKPLFEEFLDSNIRNSVSIEDFKYLPFDCLKINLPYFDGVTSVIVVKKDNELYFNFEDVGEEKTSIQIYFSKDGYVPRYTYSSMYFHREVKQISRDTHNIVEKCFDLVLGVLLYLIQFKNDKKSVVKNMYHEKYLEVHKNNMKKPKILKKIMKKRNVITLKNNMEEINYINSHCSTNVRKPNKRHLVRGHWRHYNHKHTWIKPHYRGVNNGEYLGKVYKCCG